MTSENTGCRIPTQPSSFIRWAGNSCRHVIQRQRESTAVILGSPNTAAATWGRQKTRQTRKSITPTNCRTTNCNDYKHCRTLEPKEQSRRTSSRPNLPSLNQYRAPQSAHESSNNKAKRRKRHTRLYPKVPSLNHSSNDSLKHITEEPETDTATATSSGAGLADAHTVLPLTGRSASEHCEVKGYHARVHETWVCNCVRGSRGIEWSCQTWSATKLCKLRA